MFHDKNNNTFNNQLLKSLCFIWLTIFFSILFLAESLGDHQTTLLWIIVGILNNAAALTTASWGLLLICIHAHMTCLLSIIVWSGQGGHTWRISWLSYSWGKCLLWWRFVVHHSVPGRRGVEDYFSSCVVHFVTKDLLPTDARNPFLTFFQVCHP